MFKELAEDEYLKRIEIDPALVGPFKNVMQRIEDYFQKHNYTHIRDYSKLFEEALLMPPEDGHSVRYDSQGGYVEHGAWKRKFVFEITDEPEKIGASGFYSGNLRRGIHLETQEERIVLGKEFMSTATPLEIEKVLCHEIIHFLVMGELLKNNSDPAIFNGGFVNEALTEMLSREIYPEVFQTYGAQVNMVNFANVLTGNVSNFREFLSGHIDFKGDSSEPHTWDKFMEHASKYHDNHNENDYLQAQRFLIEHCIHYRMNAEKPLTMSEYLELCSNISTLSPVIDAEWQKRYLCRVDKIYLEKVQGFKHEDIDKVAPLLSEVRELSAKKHELSDKYNVFVQRFMGQQFQFVINDNGTCNIYLNGNMIRENQTGGFNLDSQDFAIIMENLMQGKISLQNKKDNSITDIDVSKKTIEARKQESQRVSDELDEKTKILNSRFLSNDLSILFSQKYDYTQVERVSLPGLDYNENSECAYILHLRDGNTVVLNSSGEQIKLQSTVQNREISDLAAFVGLPDSFLYQLHKKCNIDKGYIGEVSENKQILLYIDSDGAPQLARSNDNFAFIGKKTMLYNEKGHGIYNSIVPPHPTRESVESKEGVILNIEDFMIEQGNNLDEKQLLDMVKGLDPKKRFYALEFIRQLSLGKDENTHDNK